MFVLFVVATILWSVIVVKAAPNAHRIHQLMIVLVTFKSLTLLSQVRGIALARARCLSAGCNSAWRSAS
jgi:cytochrome c oxidase assembly factor CtaG